MSRSRNIISFLKGFPGNKKAYFVYGPSGSGKTYAINVACKRTNYKALKVNCLNINIQTLRNYATSYFFDGKTQAIVIDNLEEIFDVQGIAKKKATTNKLLLELIESTKRPIIITMIRKPWGYTKPFEKKCVCEKFYPYNTIDIMKILNYKYPNMDVKIKKQIAEASNGDMRHALSKKTFDNYFKASENIFETYQGLFKLKNEEILNDYRRNRFMIPHFVFQNYHNNPLTKVQQIAESMSEADTVLRYPTYHGYLSTVIPIRQMRPTRYVKFPQKMKLKTLKKPPIVYPKTNIHYDGGIDGIRIMVNMAIKGDYSCMKVFADADDFKYWVKELEPVKWKKVPRKQKLAINKLFPKKQKEIVRKRKGKRGEFKQKKRRKISKKK